MSAVPYRTLEEEQGESTSVMNVSMDRSQPPTISVQIDRRSDVAHMSCQNANADADVKSFLPPQLVKLYRALQALAQCQVMLGLICCALGALYIANQGIFARVSPGIALGVYFMASGIVGICGSSTYRRGLMVAYMVMSMHSTVLFAPALIGFSVVAMLLDQHGCYLQCDLFGTDVCRMLCQGAADWDWIPNQSGRTVDIGLIVTACIELLLALVSAILCCKGVCEAFGLVDPETLQKVVKLTTITGQSKPTLQPLLPSS